MTTAEPAAGVDTELPPADASDVVCLLACRVPPVACCAHPFVAPQPEEAGLLLLKRKTSLPVLLSAKDKAAGVVLSDDGRGAQSSKGYRMVRATHGAASGAWYCEVRVERLGETGHARLGWCVSHAAAPPLPSR